MVRPRPGTTRTARTSYYVRYIYTYVCVCMYYVYVYINCIYYMYLCIRARPETHYPSCYVVRSERNAPGHDSPETCPHACVLNVIYFIGTRAYFPAPISVISFSLHTLVSPTSNSTPNATLAARVVVQRYITYLYDRIMLSWLRDVHYTIERKPASRDVYSQGTHTVQSCRVCKVSCGALCFGHGPKLPPPKNSRTRRHRSTSKSV